MWQNRRINRIVTLFSQDNAVFNVKWQPVILGSTAMLYDCLSELINNLKLVAIMLYCHSIQEKKEYCS